MTDGLGPWAKTTPSDDVRLLGRLDAPWWVAGGCAIDLAAGGVSRGHDDLDVCILRRDQPALAAALRGWDIQVALDGVLTPWTPGDWLDGRPRHQFWARPDPQSPWMLEVLLEESDGDAWVYRRNRRVSLPLAELGRRAPDGAPFIAP